MNNDSSVITLICNRKKTPIGLYSISQICADNKNITIHLKNGTHLSTYTPISAIEKMLPEEQFFRIRKNCIVAFNVVEKISKAKFRLIDGEMLKISRYRKQEFATAYENYQLVNKDLLLMMQNVPVNMEDIEKRCSIFDLYPDPTALLKIDKYGKSPQIVYANAAMEKMERKSREEMVLGKTNILPMDAQWTAHYRNAAFNGQREEALKFFPETGRTMKISCYSPFYGYCAVIITNADNVPVIGNRAVVTNYADSAKFSKGQRLFSYYEKTLYILTFLYDQVVFVNLNENHYSIITDCFSYFQDNVDMSGTFDDLFLKYRTIVHPDFREEFSEVFVRLPLLAAFQSGAKEILRQYQERSSNGTYHWVSCHVLRLVNPFNEDVVAVVLKKTYEKEQRIIENNEQKEEIIRTMENNFASVYYMDFKLRKITALKEINNEKKFFSRILKKKFFAGLALYIKKTVHPDDRKFVLEKLDFIPINEALRNEKFVVLKFRMKLSKECYEHVELTIHAAKILNNRIDEVVVVIRLINEVNDVAEL